MNLFGTICLSDIPQDLVHVSRSNGKQYLTICINEKKNPDEYGNTHYVKIYQRRDPAIQGQQDIYLGNMKASRYGEQQQAAASAQPAQPAANAAPSPFPPVVTSTQGGNPAPELPFDK